MTGTIAAWIDELSRKNTLPASCAAILIGLFESDSTYVAYLVGSNEYDPEDDDWASNQDFAPEPRYVDTELSADTPWEEVLEAVVAAVREILANGSATLLHQSPHVSVGFDDGDLVHLK